MSGSKLVMRDQTMRRETNTWTLFRTLLSTQLRQKMENNPFITSYNKTSTSSTIIDFPSQAQEGVLLVSAFIFESVMIVGGSLLTIILFVREKKLRKKSFVLSYEHGPRWCDVRSGVSAFVCLSVVRTLLSPMGCKQVYISFISFSFYWCHFFTVLADFGSFYILWKI